MLHLRSVSGKLDIMEVVVDVTVATEGGRTGYCAPPVKNKLMSENSHIKGFQAATSSCLSMSNPRSRINWPNGLCPRYREVSFGIWIPTFGNNQLDWAVIIDNA